MTELKINSKYYEDGDYVLAQVYLYNGSGEAQPSLLKSAVVTMLVQETVSLDTADLYSTSNSVSDHYKVMFVHPLNVVDLSIHVVALLNDGVTYVSGTSVVGSIEDPYAGSSFPLNTNLTPQGPRIDYSPYEAKKVEVVQPVYESTYLGDETALILCDVDFTSGVNYFKVGNSPIDYRGGGNRLLDSSSKIYSLYQEPQEYPSELGGNWLIETSATNLILNNTFLTASGWSFSQSKESLTVDIELEEYVVSSINYLSVRCRSLEAYTPTAATWSVTSDSFSISANASAVLSFFAQGTKGTNDTVVSDLNVYLNYYDMSGVYVTSVANTFATDTVLSDWTLLVVRDTVPTGVGYFSLGLMVSSFEGPDDFTLDVLLPQMEYGVDPSSRIPTTVSAVTRLADIISLPSEANIEIEKGSFILNYVPRYFSMWGDRFIFDTRDPSGLYGLYAYHRVTDGALVFVMVLGGVSPIPPLVSPAQSFTPYAEYKLKFSWSKGGLSIEVDDEFVAMWTGNVPLLPAINEILYVGEDYQRQNQLFGEIKTLTVWRDIED